MPQDTSLRCSYFVQQRHSSPQGALCNRAANSCPVCFLRLPSQRHQGKVPLRSRSLHRYTSALFRNARTAHRAVRKNAFLNLFPQNLATQSFVGALSCTIRLQREISTRYGLSCGDFFYIPRFFFDFDFGAMFCFDGCIWSISLQKQVLNLRRAIFLIFRAAAPIRCRRPSLLKRQSPAMREIKWSGSAKRKTSNDTMDVAYSRRQRSKEDSR